MSFGLASVVMSSWGTAMSACMVVANQVHHASCGSSGHVAARQPTSGLVSVDIGLVTLESRGS